MKNLKKVTVIIVTYQTPKKIINNCLKSINKRVNVLIVENSNKLEYENFIKKKFPKVKILYSGKNLGYGKGNNLGLSKTKTEYAMILNPDVICEKNFFKNLSKILKMKIKFDIIGCQFSKDRIFMPAGFFDSKKNHDFKKKFFQNNIKEFTKVEWVLGSSMLINLKKLKNRDIFDKEYFLYFEEIDLCKSIIQKGGTILTSKKLKIHHLGFKSSLSKDQKQNSIVHNIRNWHLMWSWFYFYKKNYNYFHAITKLSGKLIRSFFKTIFFLLTFQKDKKNKYLYRLLGLVNSMMGRSSFYRG